MHASTVFGSAPISKLGILKSGKVERFPPWAECPKDLLGFQRFSSELDELDPNPQKPERCSVEGAIVDLESGVGSNAGRSVLVSSAQLGTWPVVRDDTVAATV